MRSLLAAGDENTVVPQRSGTAASLTGMQGIFLSQFDQPIDLGIVVPHIKAQSPKLLFHFSGAAVGELQVGMWQPTVSRFATVRICRPSLGHAFTPSGH